MNDRQRLTVETGLTPEAGWAPMLEALGGTQRRIALVVTGGGAGAVARCFRREGASRNFVEAVIPYSHAALAEYLGSRPTDSSAGDAVAQQLAAVAMQRAGRMADDETGSDDVAGIALVAALPTTPRRRGRDRIHVVLHANPRCVVWSLELAKDAHTRESAEAIADEMVFRALAELSGFPTDDSRLEDMGLRRVRVPQNG